MSSCVSRRDDHNICIKNPICVCKMEINGKLQMFQSSERKHKVQYVNIEDGDTKLFFELGKSNAYGSYVKVKKIECVGDVQKRIRTRLCK